MNGDILQVGFGWKVSEGINVRIAEHPHSRRVIPIVSCF
jgi:hypothetical protein